MSNPDIDAIFFDLVKDIDIRKDGSDELASLEQWKVKLLKCLLGHKIDIGFIDVYNTDQYDEACYNLSSLLNEDFEKVDDLERGTEVVCTEGSLYTQRDEDFREILVYRIPAGHRLRGRVFGVLVGDIPCDSKNPDRIDFYGDGIQLPMQHFGMSLILVGTTLEDANGTRVEIAEEDQFVGIPIDAHRSMPAKKVIESK